MNLVSDGFYCPTCKTVFAAGDRCPADGSALIQTAPSGALPTGDGKQPISAIPRPSQFALQSGTADPADPEHGLDVPELSAPTDYGRLEAALGRLGAEYEPPAGWQGRVLAAVARQRGGFRWPVIALPALAMAATIMVWLVPGAEVVSRVEVVSTDQVSYRGAQRGAEGGHTWLSANPEDYVRAVASTSHPYHAIRIYHDNELLLACPEAPECRHADGALTVEAKLSRTGGYTILIFERDTPLSLGPDGDLDADKAAAIRAGIHILEREVRVQ